MYGLLLAGICTLDLCTVHDLTTLPECMHLVRPDHHHLSVLDVAAEHNTDYQMTFHEAISRPFCTLLSHIGLGTGMSTTHHSNTWWLHSICLKL